MARTFEDLIPDLFGARGLVSVPPEIGVFHLRKATIELCERSHIWRHTVTLDAQEGVGDYPIEVPAGTRLVAISQIRIGGCCLSVNRQGFCSGCACHGFRIDGDRIIIPPHNQDEEQAIMIQTAIKPLQDACDLDDDLYEDWAETIADGAASRCFAMPKSSWTSAALATYYTKRFNAGITRAKNSRVMQRATGPLLMRGARF
jgi:hypothetical protein